MDQSQIFQLLGVLFAAIINTAFFIWKLVSARDEILAQVVNAEARAESRLSTMRAALDLQVDAIQREINEHRVKIAEEYLRKDSFHLAMNKLESTTSAGLAKVEASVMRLDERVAKAIAKNNNS